jgi:hypothetical protein
MTIMLAGVAIGVRKDAAPATTISVSTGCGDTPVSTAALTATGATMSTVAALIT